MSEELKPCPFCGSEARLDQRVTQSLWNSSDAVFSHVACDECDISGQDFCDDPDGEEAIEWWNRRAQPAEAEGVKVPIVAALLIDEVFHGNNGPEAGDCDIVINPGVTEKLAQQYPGEAFDLVRQVDHLAALSAVTAERDRLLAFVTECAGTAGGMVNGNNLSNRAKEVIAAMDAKEA